VDGSSPMKAVLVLSVLLLSAVPLAPVASAGHCGPEPLLDEVQCIAWEVAIWTVNAALCFYNTAPSSWLRVCVPPILA